MIRNNPLVSIIIPVYNRALLLKETLDSVLEQNYIHWECIIIDDGSTDQTQKIIEEYCKKDQRFKFYRRPEDRKKGASACRNYGFEKSLGDLIQYLDSDDLMCENKLLEQVEILIKTYNREKTLVICKWGGFINKSNLNLLYKSKYQSYRNYLKGIDLLNTFGFYNEYFPLHVYLASRELIKTSGPWNENLTNNDDAEFFSRVVLNSKQILFSPDTSVYYRYNSYNKLSEINNLEKVNSLLLSWKLIEKNIMHKADIDNSKYLRRAKYNLFSFLSLHFPNVVIEEKNFLRNRNNFDSKYYNFLKRFARLINSI